MRLTQQTTTIAIIVAVAVVLLAGAVGYLKGREDAKTQTSNSQATNSLEAKPEQSELAEHKPEEPHGEGVIMGSLTYPSEGIPAGIVVHAYNIDTHQDFSVKDRIEDNRFTYGKGYKLTVPAGRYHVYGVYEEVFPGQRAYFDEYIKCQLQDSTAECADYSKIIVTVEPGEEYSDAIVGNWYKTCVMPGGKQPTEKFDLPTC